MQPPPFCFRPNMNQDRRHGFHGIARNVCYNCASCCVYRRSCAFLPLISAPCRRLHLQSIWLGAGSPENKRLPHADAVVSAHANISMPANARNNALTRLLAAISRSRGRIWARLAVARLAWEWEEDPFSYRRRCESFVIWSHFRCFWKVLHETL
ncbi:hypothetical protein K491DRAFT_241680 [Lophiostoma macrostomum CBS 122681]|uniref:Uncharacterized protein n=1 Tax=Lophiostoma macrostomum CBS 122681 TaxID=1314788 RepID=A0A6A6SLQ8_9PLEO|nr:hypothetical protein K491DRAFT_241680 [Lophiostoma macrostomum CBS 122681]